MTSISAGTTNSIIVMDYDGCGDLLVNPLDCLQCIYLNKSDLIVHFINKIQRIINNSESVYFINGSVRINDYIDDILSTQNQNGNSLIEFPYMINDINDHKKSFISYFIENTLNKCVEEYKNFKKPIEKKFVEILLKIIEFQHQKEKKMNQSIFKSNDVKSKERNIDNLIESARKIFAKNEDNKTKEIIEKIASILKLDKTLYDKVTTEKYTYKNQTITYEQILKGIQISIDNIVGVKHKIENIKKNLLETQHIYKKIIYCNLKDQIKNNSQDKVKLDIFEKVMEIAKTNQIKRIYYFDRDRELITNTDWFETHSANYNPRYESRFLLRIKEKFETDKDYFYELIVFDYTSSLTNLCYVQTEKGENTCKRDHNNQEKNENELRF